MENEYSKEFCHLCLDEFEDSSNNDGTIVECPACGRAYHKACWDANGGCVGGAECNEKKEPAVKASFGDDSTDSDVILYKSESNFKKIGTVIIWIAMISLLVGFIGAGFETFFIAVGAIAFVALLIIGLIVIFSSYSVTITSKKIIVSCTHLILKKSISTYTITDVYYRNFIPMILIYTSGCKTKLHLIKNGNEVYKTISSLLDERDF